MVVCKKYNMLRNNSDELEGIPVDLRKKDTKKIGGFHVGNRATQ